MEIEKNIDDELRAEAQEKGEIATKILNALVFNKFGGIEYSMVIRKNRNTSYPNQKGKLYNPFYFEFDVVVDVDKTFESSPTYDKNYGDYIYEISEHIENALQYVALQGYMEEPIFNFVNDDLVEIEIYKLQNKLVLYLQSRYKGLSHDSIREADIFYSFYKGEGWRPYMRVEFVGHIPEEKEYFSCGELYDIMKDLFDKSPLSLSYDSEDFTCN